MKRCAVYIETKRENRRTVIAFVIGGACATLFALMVGCGAGPVEATPRVIEQPSDPINLFNRCLFEREMCEKTQPTSICEKEQNRCLENK